MPTELYLVRHGEARANVDAVIGGITGDTGLTERGQHQAARLGDRLRASGLQADHLVASTLPRALETAEQVSRALGLPVERDDDLQELRPGDADGMLFADWRARDPEHVERLWTDPYLPFAPGGESWAGFVTRVGGALTRIVRHHSDQTVMAVCHGGVIDAAFHLAFGLGPPRRTGFGTTHTGITHWRHHPPEGHAPEWTLLAYNDASHLLGDRVDGDLAAAEASPVAVRPRS